MLLGSSSTPLASASECGASGTPSKRGEVGLLADVTPSIEGKSSADPALAPYLKVSDFLSRDDRALVNSALVLPETPSRLESRLGKGGAVRLIDEDDDVLRDLEGFPPTPLRPSFDASTAVSPA